jgi:hypothetical protein
MSFQGPAKSPAVCLPSLLWLQHSAQSLLYGLVSHVLLSDCFRILRPAVGRFKLFNTICGF